MKKAQMNFIAIVFVLLLLVIVAFVLFYLYNYSEDLTAENINRVNFISFNSPHLRPAVLQGQYIVPNDCGNGDTFISYGNFVEEEGKQDMLNGYYVNDYDLCGSPKVFIAYDDVKEENLEEEVIHNLYYEGSCDCEGAVMVSHSVPPVIETRRMNSVYVENECCC